VNLGYRPGDGRAVHPEPAGKHVMGDAVPQVHQGGQEPIHEHQLVLRAGTHRPPPRTRGQH
jgi:hypothetical protein